MLLEVFGSCLMLNVFDMVGCVCMLSETFFKFWMCFNELLFFDAFGGVWTFACGVERCLNVSGALGCFVVLCRLVRVLEGLGRPLKPLNNFVGRWRCLNVLMSLKGVGWFSEVFRSVWTCSRGF